MSITWSQVLEVAPELSTIAAATQTYILSRVDREVDDDAWLDFADDGRRYLAAHLATIASGGGAAGPVISETLGPMSRGYAFMMGNNVDPLLSTTKYGVQYLHLIRMLPSSIGFVP